ncbi:hypothetical protein C8J57DRAFT_1235865 [Mycena rebaudengoi]|nr:hypothetical protein C8J57DRAFT_1235865 [Mycena rebaudengoi]
MADNLRKCLANLFWVKYFEKICATQDIANICKHLSKSFANYLGRVFLMAVADTQETAGRVGARAGGKLGWHHLGEHHVPAGSPAASAHSCTATVDIAHTRSAALDIGVPSVANLPHIHRKRLVGWLALAVTATLLNFFWNSTIFTSIPVVSIPRALATSDFLEAGDDWSKTDPLSHPWWQLPTGWDDTVTFDLSPIYSMKTKVMNMTWLEPKDCIYESLDPLSSTRSVLVVAKNLTSAKNNLGSSLLDGWTSGWGFWDAGGSWLCAVYDLKEYKYFGLSQQQMATLGDEWAVRVGVGGFGGSILVPPNILVDYCLVGDAADNEGRCGLHHSMQIMIVVCACTVVEFVLLLWTAFYFRKRGNLKAGLAGKRQRNLVTMGDYES